jgi:hypothetical protein
MRRLIVGLLLVIACSTAEAADIWVLHGRVSMCRQLLWSTDTYFLNTNTAPAVVRLLGVSDGPDSEVNRQFTLPPNTLTALSLTIGGGWGPAPRTTATVFLHLDVPDGVIFQNVLNVGTEDCLLLPSADTSAVYGSVPLPTFRSLVPAGETRHILGADLGQIDGRTNIGVYNAGSEPAVADVQMIHGCDGAVQDHATITLAPNSSQQVSLHAGTSVCKPADNTTQGWKYYATVTVSQPSLSYVANIVNGETPRGLLSVK